MAVASCAEIVASCYEIVASCVEAVEFFVSPQLWLVMAMNKQM